MKKVSLFINTYASKKLPDLHTAPTEKKTSIAIKTNVKISSLLPSISGQSRTSIRPIQIYVDINVSLLRFKYPVTLKKITRNVIV